VKTSKLRLLLVNAGREEAASLENYYLQPQLVEETMASMRIKTKPSS